MKRLKRFSKLSVLFFLSILVIITLLYPVTGAQDTKLSDISGTPYFDPVVKLETAGIIAGYPDGTFRPERSLSRAEAVTLVYRAYGSSRLALASPYRFHDVPSGMWASSFINYCAGAGIINGYPDGSFRPDREVTYNEIITLIVRARGMDTGDLSWPEGYLRTAGEDGMLDQLHQVSLPSDGNAPANRGNTAILIACGSEYNAVASDGPVPDYLADPNMTCHCYGLVTNIYDKSASSAGRREWGRMLMGHTVYDLQPAETASGLFSGYNPAYGLIRIRIDNGQAVSAQKVTNAWNPGVESGLLTPEAPDPGLTRFCRVASAENGRLAYLVGTAQGGTVYPGASAVYYEIGLDHGAPAAAPCAFSDIREGDMAAVFSVTGSGNADVVLIVHPEYIPDILHATENENIMYMG